MIKLSLFNFLLWTISFGSVLAQQEVYVKPLLEMLEEGRSQDVANLLQALTRENPKDPGVRFLNAVFNPDATAATETYKDIVKNFPKSSVANKAAERLVMYYQVMNEPQLAQSYIDFIGREDTDDNLQEIRKVNQSIQQQKQIDVRNTPVPSPGKFFVQIGAYGASNQATTVLNKAKSSGFSGKVVKEITNKKEFHKVRIGPFSSQDEARNTLTSIKSKIGINGFIVEE